MKLPVQLPHPTKGLVVLLLFSGLAAPTADLFVKKDIPGWSSIPRYASLGAWGDYDGDGYLDVFVARVQNADFSGVASNLLYRNNGDGSFVSKLEAEVGPIVGDPGAWLAGHWIDVNGDGHLDLWAQNSGFAPPSYSAVICPLYLNRGDGTFASVQAGALTQPLYPWSVNSDWADYDNDGLLDVIIPMGWDQWETQTNALLRGLADGTFEAVTTGPVVTDRSLSGNDSIWADLDNDGDSDLLMANNFVPAFYYRNDGPGWFTRMTNSLLERPAYQAVHHNVADMDNDGDLDVVARGSSTFVFRNDGAGGFTLAQTLIGGTWEEPYFGDYDNDGDVDLLFSEYSGGGRPVSLYRNDGKGKFTAATEAFTGVTPSSIVGPWIDIDNNGFLDLVMGHGIGTNHPVALYQNQGNGNHWLKFRLVGTRSNRSALGAKVRVHATIGGEVVRQLRFVSSSIWAEDGGRPHFGLGTATEAATVRVEWPSGIVQDLANVAADQLLTVTEPTLVRLSCSRVAEGARLEWRGDANTVYTLQAAASPTGWVDTSPQITSDATGAASATVSVEAAQRFYRVVKR